MTQKKKKKNAELFKYAGETLQWAPTWKGGRRGKKWSTRLKEIQSEKSASIQPPSSKTVRRRPQPHHMTAERLSHDTSETTRHESSGSREVESLQGL